MMPYDDAALFDAMIQRDLEAMSSHDFAAWLWALLF